MTKFIFKRSPVYEDMAEICRVAANYSNQMKLSENEFEIDLDIISKIKEELSIDNQFKNSSENEITYIIKNNYVLTLAYMNN